MTTTYTNPADAVAHVIEKLFHARRWQGHGPGVSIVFSGEGHTPADATRDAIADIVAQCDANRCTPASIVIDGVMRTDHGYRVWGTFGCDEERTDGPPPAQMTDFDMREEEGGAWTLTMGAE